jgi:hypothetical protein
MAYTRQELFDAFCAARGCELSDLPKIQVEIQERLDKRRAELQAEVDAIPTLAKTRMKTAALDYLNKQVNDASDAQAKIDNDGVSL